MENDGIDREKKMTVGGYDRDNRYDKGDLERDESDSLDNVVGDD